MQQYFYLCLAHFSFVSPSLGEAKEETDCDDGSENDVRWVWDEGYQLLSS